MVSEDTMNFEKCFEELHITQKSISFLIKQTPKDTEEIKTLIKKRSGLEKIANRYVLDGKKIPNEFLHYSLINFGGTDYKKSAYRVLSNIQEFRKQVNGLFGRYILLNKDHRNLVVGKIKNSPSILMKDNSIGLYVPLHEGYSMDYSNGRVWEKSDDLLLINPNTFFPKLFKNEEADGGRTWSYNFSGKEKTFVYLGSHVAKGLKELGVSPPN